MLNPNRSEKKNETLQNVEKSVKECILKQTCHFELLYGVGGADDFFLILKKNEYNNKHPSDQKNFEFIFWTFRKNYLIL